MNNKLLIRSVINRFLVGALAPVSLAKNFNMVANGNNLFYINGTSGDAWFGHNVKTIRDFCVSGGII